ncbi:MAG: hypothetical protein IJM24_01235 [Clostridia bacterium]|nr:hypothetical protein [Clostridia bacterium]
MSIKEFLRNLFKKTEKEIVAAASKKSETVTLSALPENKEAMLAMPEFDRTNPYKVAAFTVAALNRFTASKDECYAMLNDLKGPEPLSNYEKEFIRDRFMDGKDYVVRSYFAGATPDNDYAPTIPYKVTLIEQSNSRENVGYISLWIPSGGADNPRMIKLRQKASTKEWFLYQVEFLLGDIRIPKSRDEWA